MTTKQLFKQILDYARTHPSEAAMFLEALEAPRDSGDKEFGQTTHISNSHTADAPSEVDAVEELFTAKEVGRAVGKTDRWVLDHMNELVGTTPRRSERGHRAWLFTNEALRQYRILSK